MLFRSMAQTDDDNPEDREVDMDAPTFEPMVKVGKMCIRDRSCIAISCTQNLEEGDQDNGGNLLHRVAIGLTEPELLSIAYDSANELSEEAATDILSDFIAAKNVSRSSMSTFSLTNKFTINEVNNATRSANKDHVTCLLYTSWLHSRTTRICWN